jgi:hypothetical protein
MQDLIVVWRAKGHQLHAEIFPRWQLQRAATRKRGKNQWIGELQENQEMSRKRIEIFWPRYLLLVVSVWTTAILVWKFQYQNNVPAPKIEQNLFNERHQTYIEGSDSDTDPFTSLLKPVIRSNVKPENGLCLSIENPFDRPCLLFWAEVRLTGIRGSPTDITTGCRGLCLTQQNLTSFQPRGVTAWYHEHPVQVTGVPRQSVNATLIDRPAILMIWNDLAARTNMFHAILLAIYPLFAAMLQLGISRDNEIFIVDSLTTGLGYFEELLRLFSKNPVKLLPAYWGQTLHFKSLLVGVTTGSWARSSVNVFGPDELQRADPVWAYLRSFIQAGIGCRSASINLSQITVIRRADRGISNLAELTDALASVPRLQTQVVALETHPFKAQIETMSKTACLIGMHGAGLTHMIFLRPFSSVVELIPVIARPLGHPTVCYRNLAISLGLPHTSLRASSSNCSNSDARSCTANVFLRSSLVDLVTRAIAQTRLFFDTGQDVI